MRRASHLLAAVLPLLLSVPASAQQAQPSRIAVDTVAAIDEVVDASGGRSVGLVVDAVASVGLGRGFEVVAWPVAQRISGTGNATADLWIATLRYEHRAAIGVRIDAGLLAAPVGLANLSVRRAHLNPTIGQPAALFSPLPTLEVGAPRPNLLGAIYPFGTQLTVSGTRWDARAALIDSSPLRRRGVFADPKPPRFTNVVVGGGITPFVGFRVGASFTHGGWIQAGESPTAITGRNATVATIESDLSFAYTKVAGEWVRDTIETSTGTRVATGWFVQGQQTLTPRWFIAGRVERLASPLVTLTTARVRRMTNSEAVIGYRLSPQWTVRAGHRARRAFSQTAFSHEFVMSFVWWQRWL